MQLTDKEDLLDLLEMDGYKLLLQEMEALVRAQELKVLQYSLTDTNSIQELALEKARAEGANRLFDAFKRRMNTIRPTKK
jgi:hypothetical protein